MQWTTETRVKLLGPRFLFALFRLYSKGFLLTGWLYAKTLRGDDVNGKCKKNSTFHTNCTRCKFYGETWHLYINPSDDMYGALPRQKAHTTLCILLRVGVSCLLGKFDCS